MLRVGDPLQEELDVPECMRLLRTATLGHLGFTQSALPTVLPVAYRLTSGTVLIPAVAQSRWASALRDGIVVLGVDSFGGDPTDAWAVTVVGPIRLVGTPRETATTPTDPAPGCHLELQPVLVTGWRRRAAPDA